MKLMFITTLLFLLPSTMVMAESEFKTLLTEDSYSEMVEYLDYHDYDYKGKYQQNYYFDIDGFIIKRSGLNIRIRISDGSKGKKAKLTIKDSNRTTFKHNFKLKAKSLSIKDEYECKIKKMDKVEKIINNPSLIFSLTKKDCKIAKSSLNGIHPVDFLVGFIEKRRLFSPDSSKQETISLNMSVNELKEQLKIMATNTNSRKKVKISFAGEELKLELDKTSFANGSVRYSAELDVTDIDDQEEVMVQVYKEFEEFITGFGVPVNPPLAGKTTVSIIIAEKDTNKRSRHNLFRLFINGDLIK